MNEAGLGELIAVQCKVLPNAESFPLSSNADIFLFIIRRLPPHNS